MSNLSRNSGLKSGGLGSRSDMSMSSKSSYAGKPPTSITMTKKNNKRYLGSMLKKGVYTRYLSSVGSFSGSKYSKKRKMSNGSSRSISPSPVPNFRHTANTTPVKMNMGKPKVNRKTTPKIKPPLRPKKLSVSRSAMNLYPKKRSTSRNSVSSKVSK